ncbi:uncharacterized protein [Dermacentor albipictus]|uniref:uncharacterized protein isoform X2 n=1 Tax=Dermacentor albipictus TaxID=60249 RepID=UPI0031FE3514
MWPRDQRDVVIVIGACCLVINVIALLKAALTPMPSELDPTLRTVSTAVSISYNSASCILSIAWIWGAYHVKRGLLQNVVLGTKIRIVVTAILMAFILYVMSQMEKPSLIHILGETREFKSVDAKTVVLQSVNILSLALRNSAGNDKHPDKRNDDIDEKTKKIIQKLALENPTDKDKDKDPEKKKDNVDEKSASKFTAMAWAVLQFILVLCLEVSSRKYSDKSLGNIRPVFVRRECRKKFSVIAGLQKASKTSFRVHRLQIGPIRQELTRGHA